MGTGELLGQPDRLLWVRGIMIDCNAPSRSYECSKECTTTQPVVFSTFSLIQRNLVSNYNVCVG